jgi:hypothetical protein
MTPVAVLAVTATGWGFSIRFILDHASDRQYNDHSQNEQYNHGAHTNISFQSPEHPLLRYF